MSYYVQTGYAGMAAQAAPRPAVPEIDMSDEPMIIPRSDNPLASLTDLFNKAGSGLSALVAKATGPAVDTSYAQVPKGAKQSLLSPTNLLLVGVAGAAVFLVTRKKKGRR